MRVPAVGDHPHHLGRAADRGDREAAAEPLGQRGQVRGDAEPLLRAAPAEPESGDDLVEDQQRAVRAGLAAQQLQVAGLRQDAAGVEDGRLGDDGRDLVAALGHHPAQAVGIVPGQDDQGVRQLKRHAGPGRDRARALGAGRDRVDVVRPVDRVLPAVVVPLEPDDQPAAGVGAGEPDGGADHLAAGVGEAHHLDAGDGVDDLGGGLHLQLVGQPRAGPELGDGPGHRLGDDGVAVPEDHRAEAEQVIDVGVAVDVGDPGAGAAGDERRVWLPAELHRPRAAARTAGHDLAGVGEQLRRPPGPLGVTLVKVHRSSYSHTLYNKYVKWRISPGHSSITTTRIERWIPVTYG